MVSALALFEVILFFFLNITEGLFKFKGTNELDDDAIFPNGFNGSSCYSRYDPLLHKPQARIRKPSPYFVSKLRSYEARHWKCAPYTDLYNRSVEALKNNKLAKMECNYIVWLPIDGLGNRMISLASTFLYALLTDRVLLVHPKDSISDLFCEPFPQGSWLIPIDFPLLDRINGFHKTINVSFGQLLKNNLLGNKETPQPFLYIHLKPDYDQYDKRFFCDEDHLNIRDVPWLFLLSDLYFTPSFFSMDSFKQELQAIFPNKETVFYLLARYLFHPTNDVWGLVKRFYQGYLSDADIKVGIEIRNLYFQNALFQDVFNQIVSCTMNESLLPRVYKQKQQNLTASTMKKTKIAALLTSLRSDYFKELAKMYWEYDTTTGETVAIHQPSFEEHQATGNLNHDKKALAEMYLLSLTDKLVTSATSTFGYVAQGLGGLTPWMILKPKDKLGQDQPCRRVLSMEPCYLTPPNYDCKLRRESDTSINEPHLRRCVDGTLMGIKLVNI